MKCKKVVNFEVDYLIIGKTYHEFGYVFKLSSSRSM